MSWHPCCTHPYYSLCAPLLLPRAFKLTTNHLISSPPSPPLPPVFNMAEAEVKVNAMKKLRLEKLCVNICVGESGDRLTRAAKVLKQLTGQEPVFSKARYTVRTFSIRRNEKISCHCTVRGDKAMEILERGLKVKEFELWAENFSETGNFGFGKKEDDFLSSVFVPFPLTPFIEIAHCMGVPIAMRCGLLFDTLPPNLQTALLAAPTST